MSAFDTVAKVYAELQPQLSPTTASALKFRPAKKLEKFGLTNTGGRILGKQAGKVWDAKWCFYSVAIGPDQHDRSRVGGIGFGCAVNQKVCGEGKHEAILLEIAARLRKAHPHFHHSSRGSSWLNIGINYQPSGGHGFPVTQAAQDLAALITGTFASIDALIV